MRPNPTNCRSNLNRAPSQSVPPTQPYPHARLAKWARFLDAKLVDFSRTSREQRAHLSSGVATASGPARSRPLHWPGEVGWILQANSTLPHIAGRLLFINAALMDLDPQFDTLSRSYIWSLLLQPSSCMRIPRGLFHRPHSYLLGFVSLTG